MSSSGCLQYMKMSKHVGVQITQRDRCDIHIYDINCAFVGCNKKIIKDAWYMY